MKFQQGNDFYKIRSKDGREPIFESPNELIDAANEYFEWVINNPLKEQVLFHAQGVITKGEADKIRPFSREGMCNHMGIVLNTFKNYAKNPDFLTVTTLIEQIIDNQQYEGAAAGLLNANIIARKLGLSDKSEQTHKIEQPLFGDDD